MERENMVFFVMCSDIFTENRIHQQSYNKIKGKHIVTAPHERSEN